MRPCLVSKAEASVRWAIHASVAVATCKHGKISRCRLAYPANQTTAQERRGIDTHLLLGVNLPTVGQRHVGNADLEEERRLVVQPIDRRENLVRCGVVHKPVATRIQTGGCRSLRKAAGSPPHLTLHRDETCYLVTMYNTHIRTALSLKKASFLHLLKLLQILSLPERFQEVCKQDVGNTDCWVQDTGCKGSAPTVELLSPPPLL